MKVKFNWKWKTIPRILWSLTFAAFGGGCDTFSTRPYALAKDFESRTTKVPGGALRKSVAASSRVIFGLYQYLEESRTNLRIDSYYKGYSDSHLMKKINKFATEYKRTWRAVERRPEARCWCSRSRSFVVMCSKTLNHSDSLRGECADQCASPCCERPRRIRKQIQINLGWLLGWDIMTWRCSCIVMHVFWSNKIVEKLNVILWYISIIQP